MPTPMPVTIDGWSADVGARLELAWAASLFVSLVVLALLSAVVFTLLSRGR